VDVFLLGFDRVYGFCRQSFQQGVSGAKCCE
jgi:hypothetical protein